MNMGLPRSRGDGQCLSPDPQPAPPAGRTTIWFVTLKLGGLVARTGDEQPRV